MKIHYEDDLEHQNKAINAVINLFKNCLYLDNNDTHPILYNYPNLEENLLEILKENNIDAQEKEKLYTTKELNHVDKILQQENILNPHFAIEMETGTGKTYTYIKTILELATQYNLKRFIIVVPNVAIRNGVIETLKDSKKYFSSFYKIHYNFFEYDSSKINYLKNFKESPNVEICIINAQSFNSSDNIINKITDFTQGETPMQWVASCKPVIIIDEPQANSGVTTKIKLEEFNPLFKLEYSATLPKNNAILLYKFGPISAYSQGLVKQIEVVSTIKNKNALHNNAYVCFKSIVNNKGSIKAKLELHSNKINSLKTFDLICGESLEQQTNNNVYANYILEHINENEITISNLGKIKKGETKGDDLSDFIKKEQIKQTIQAHLNKMLDFKNRNLDIKILSLFFIDKVVNYRGENGIDGKFKIWFNEIYTKLTSQDEYKILNMPHVDDAQKAYFAQDKNKQFKDVKVVQDSEDKKQVFALIMKDKAKLLSKEEPCQFIFSHSAISIGWDNPNVFQICTLNETKSNTKKRQEIGRGLRLPLNSKGDRIRDKSVNILSVITNESYEEFAKNLQKELIEDCGENIKEGYIAETRKKYSIKLKTNFDKDENFIELWNRLKYKTKYNVNIDIQNFIKNTIQAINDNANLKYYKLQLNIITHKISNLESVANSNIKETSISSLHNTYNADDILTKIAGSTNLSKKTLLSILKGLDESILNNIFKNPIYILNEIKNIIQNNLIECLSKGIKYTKLHNQEFQLQEVFINEELVGDFVELEKSIYNGFIADSNAEKNYALEHTEGEKNINTKLFIKLPKRFYINTPQGKYSPDFALCIDDENTNKTYLIVETKTTDNQNELRVIENIKINCANKHFEALDIRDISFKPIAIKT
jgi:type III restriction enzyme